MYRLKLREVSYALSEALDLVGIDDLHHGKRVAYMAGELCKKLNFTQDRVDEMINIGMLHDCGVSKTDTHHYLISELDWENSQNHCQRGADLVKKVRFYKSYADTILYHHTHWSDLKNLNIDEETKINTNIIHIVDRFDALRTQEKTKSEITNILKEQKNKMFKSELVDSFIELSQPNSFHLYLEYESLDLYLRDWVNQEAEQEYDYKYIKEIALMFSDIVDAKSSFTAEHSLNVSKVCMFIANKLGLDEERIEVLEIAGLLHDLGKLRVDDSILEKKGPLDAVERHIMDRHGFDSEMILRRISGFKDIAALAASHHETLDGKGYPYQKNEAQLSIEARILMVSDVFQALVQNRPYRKQLDTKKIIDILEEMQEELKIDPIVLNVIEDNLAEIYKIAEKKERNVMKKRTKILATIGPASDSVEMIEKLIHAGVNVFRLNFSHGTHEYHHEVLQRIREVEQKCGLFIGVLQDISGPKIRIGKLDKPFELRSGDTVEFVKEDITGTKLTDTSYKTCINQPSILSQLKVGELVYLYDGIIRTEVIEVSSDSVKVSVQNSGILTSKKGVNFPNTRLGIDVLTPKDKIDMLWGIENNVDFMAISFVQDASDMIEARKILTDKNADIQLFAKIEKFDAVENIDAILEHSDGIMVARGDLGIEVPFYEVPVLQKMLIEKANEASKPVITATQMLLSMTINETATRAEISDIANAVLDGTDAVMLSEESATGAHPVLAVETMVKTIQGVEKVYPYNKFSKFKIHDVTESINKSAVRLCEDIDGWGLIVLSTSGSSVKKIARYRPRRDVYAVVHDVKTAKSLTVCWGVIPAFLVIENSLEHVISEVVNQGVDKKILHLNKSYIITAGDPVGVVGSTNMIKILREDEMIFFKSFKK